MAVTEKRQLDETVYSTKHIVLDIEGTTTSISFVKDTLFPYVRKNLDGYINSHWTEEEFKDVLALLKNQAAEDVKAAMEGAIEIPSDGSDDDVKAAIAKSVLWQMDSDRKTTALKKLQGQMWRQGYKTGELKGHVFADVAPSLKEWVKDGRKLYVYSSGSVEAQKLLFGNSTEGDLTELFTDFFDTEVGAKVDVESYKSIVKKLDCKADDVLFLTDLPKEASAAREAGLPVILVEREGNEAIANELRKEFSAVSSFQELAFESSSKKQKVEGDSNVGKVDDNKTADASVMEVDPAEKPEEKTEAKDVEAEPMDVDKQDVEPVKEAETAAENKIEVKIEENGSSVVDRKEEIEVKKAEVTETKPDTEVKEVSDISVKEAEPSESVKAEEKISEVKKDATPETVEKEKVTEKTDVVVPDEKTEEQDTEKVETESGNAEPKEDTKTEGNRSEPETVKEVEESQVEKKEDTVKETVEVKNETEKEIAADVDTKKEDDSDKVSVKEIPEEKEVIETETKEIAPETEVSKETNETEDTKSVKAEEKTASVESETKVEAEQKGDLEDKEKVNGTSNGTSNGISNGTTNGNSNGTANGAKEADTNGTVENGHSKLEKEGIPEVIVAKNTTQIENGSADAAVVVEA